MEFVKLLVVLNFLLLLLIPLAFAENNSEIVGNPAIVNQEDIPETPSKVDLGSTSIHGEERENTDLFVFLLIMFIFVVVIFECITFVGVVEKQWMRWAISSLVVFLMNSNAFLFNTFYALKDFQKLINSLTSVTLLSFFKVLFFILVFFFSLVLIKGLLKKLKETTIKEIRDEELQQVKKNVEIKKIRDS